MEAGGGGIFLIDIGSGINLYFYRIKWLGQLSQIRVPEKRSLKTKQKPNQTRIANLGIRLRLKVHFVFDKWSFHFMKTL